MSVLSTIEYARHSRDLDGSPVPAVFALAEPAWYITIIGVANGPARH